MKPTRHISMMEQCSMKYTATDKTAKEKTKSKNIKTRVIPGYHLSLGIVVTMLSVIVLIPLASVLVYSLKISPGDFVALIMKENVRNAFITSITSSFIAAIVNVVFGLIVAWTLVKIIVENNQSAIFGEMNIQLNAITVGKRLTERGHRIFWNSIFNTVISTMSKTGSTIQF